MNISYRAMIGMTAEYSPDTMNARKQWKTLKTLKENKNNYHTSILYSEKNTPQEYSQVKSIKTKRICLQQICSTKNVKGSSSSWRKMKPNGNSERNEVYLKLKIFG